VKVLPTSEGGTMMFYPEKASKIMQGRLEKMNTDDRGGEGGGRLR
jgi:hypothetical protein